MAVRVRVRMIMRVTVTVRVSVVMSSALFPGPVIVLPAQVVVSISGVQNFHLNQIENEAHNRDNQHDAALDLGRLEEAHGGFAYEPHGHDPDGGHRDERADDFSAMPPVSQVVTRRTLAQSQRRN